MKWILKLASLPVLLLLSVSLLHAETFTPTEYQVKAAFLYNFAKFVEWPTPTVETSSGSFLICVVGDDPFRQDLDEQLAGKSIQDKTIIIKRLTRSGDLSECQMVYLSASEASHLDAILKPLEEKPVLTVSDMRHFVQGGGIVGLSLDKNKVRFNVNLDVAEKTGLKISSQLLKLAKLIIGKPVEPE